MGLKFKAFLFLLVSFLFINCVFANVEDANLGEKADTAYIIHKFKETPKKERDEFMHFGLKNPSQIPPIYFIAFADEYYNRDKVRAIYLYMLGNLRSKEDVMMCEDKTARGQIASYPSYAPKTVELISNLTKEEKKNIFNLALQWDKTHPDRVSPKWACYNGMQAFYREVGIYPMEKFPKIQRQVRKEMLEAIE